MNELGLFRLVMDNFGNVGALLLAGALLIFLINKMRNGSKVDNAHGDLYAQLSAQLQLANTEIARLNQRIGAVYDERNALKEDLVKLNQRVAALEECEHTVEVLKARLAQKDDQIRERDVENRTLMHEILQLKDRLHHLELRLSQDGAQFCKDCVKK